MAGRDTLRRNFLRKSIVNINTKGNTNTNIYRQKNYGMWDTLRKNKSASLKSISKNIRKFHTRGIKVVSKLSNLEFGSLESHKVWPFQHEMCRNRVKNCSWIQSSKISHMILQIWDISGWLKELIINYIYCKFFNVWWKLDFLFFFLRGEMREQPINCRRSNVFPAFSDKKKGGAGLSWHLCKSQDWEEEFAKTSPKRAMMLCTFILASGGCDGHLISLQTDRNMSNEQSTSSTSTEISNIWYFDVWNGFSQCLFVVFADLNLNVKSTGERILQYADQCQFGARARIEKTNRARAFPHRETNQSIDGYK